MVVRFDLDAHRVLVVKLDDSRVVNEDTERPVNAVGHEFVRRSGNGRLEQVVDRDGPIGSDRVPGSVGPINDVVSGTGVMDVRLERFVDAVL